MAYGPVIPEVYEEYSTLGDKVITSTMDIEGQTFVISGNEAIPIFETINEYGSRTGSQLIDLTHKKNGAWYNSFSNGGYRKNISLKEIKKEFECPIQ